MSKDPKERILDVCLGEILGGQTPPDLAPQIMRKLEAKRFAGKEGLNSSLDSKNGAMANAVNGIENASLQNDSSVVTLVSRKSARTHHRSPWWSLTVVAAVAALGISVGFGLLSIMNRGQDHDVAEQETQPGPAIGKFAKDNSNKQPPEFIASEQLKTDRAKAEPDKDSQLAKQEVINKQNPAETLVDHDPNVFPNDHRIANSTNDTPKPDLKINLLPQPEIVAAIDSGLQRIWQQHSSEPGKAVDDSEWCGRAILAVTGREATAQELKSFLALPKDDRRTQFLRQLFQDEDVLDEFASTWSVKLASAFLGTPITAKDQIAVQDKPVAQLLAHLRRSLVENRTYDKIAAELLTACGTIRPTDDDYDGANGFLIALYKHHGDDRDYKNTTSQIARSFWGQRLQCAQCHDDQVAGLAQDDFWQVNAMLRDFKVVDDNGSPRLANQPLSNDPIFYETASGRLVAVKPTLKRHGSSEVSARGELARQIIADEKFCRRAVNLVWSELLGYGLVHPVDDMGPHNPAVDPALLNQLSEQFAANGQDLRKLISWIVLSEAFNRPTTADRLGDDHPETNGKALFTLFYRRNHSGLPTQDSLELVVKAYDGTTDRSNAARRALLGKIAPASSASTQIIDASGIQDISSWGIGESYASTLESIAVSKLDNQQKIEHLFWLAVGRNPTSQESAICVKLLETDPESGEKILQDIWWAISPR